MPLSGMIECRRCSREHGAVLLNPSSPAKDA